MNATPRYERFALCREMRETAAVLRRFDRAAVTEHLPVVPAVVLSGEGSSRIFPAKRAIAHSLRSGWETRVVTEGASQAREYDLGHYHLYVASNSGKTAEGVNLLRSAVPRRSTAVVACDDTPIVHHSDTAFVLGCGPEQAVAATKSVVEQALFYDELLRQTNGDQSVDLAALSDGIAAVLQQEIPEPIVALGTKAPVLYFGGRNDGVAEELTLKTNEITRKRSHFLEGTYAVHGIEEVMQPGELVIIVDPFPEEEQKFKTVLVDGVGASVIAIAHRATAFPTIQLPDLGSANPYLQLAAGWNLLVEIGIAAGIDLDKPERARKVGNEYGV